MAHTSIPFYELLLAGELDIWDSKKKAEIMEDYNSWQDQLPEKKLKILHKIALEYFFWFDHS